MSSVWNLAPRKRIWQSVGGRGGARVSRHNWHRNGKISSAAEFQFWKRPQCTRGANGERGRLGGFGLCRVVQTFFRWVSIEPSPADGLALAPTGSAVFSQFVRTFQRNSATPLLQEGESCRASAADELFCLSGSFILSLSFGIQKR